MKNTVQTPSPIWFKSLKCILFLPVLMLFTLQARAQTRDTLYTSQGKLYQIITTEDDSKRVQTFSYGGSPEKDERFKDGKKHGLQIEYYSYGKPKIEAHYEEGFLSGLYKEYFQGADLMKEVHYEVFEINDQKKSLMHGHAKYYHHNGYLAREGEYEQGEEEGEWTYYDQNGQISEERIYEDGKMAGTHITYHPNGEIQSKGEVYEDVTVDKVHYDKMYDGWIKRYFSNGQEASFTEIDKGTPTGNEKHWYEEGGLRRVMELEDENHRVAKYYDPEGELSLRVEEKKSLKNGNVRWVKHGEERNYKDGKLSSLTHYAHGERHGKFENYGEDGEIQMRGENYKGKLVGVYKSYYPNGQLERVQQKEFITYWRGDTGIVDHGWQRRFSEEGQLTYAALKDLGQDVYEARYSDQGHLLSRSYHIHGLKWSQEFYPRGELKSDLVTNRQYWQKGVWYINGVPQMIEIHSNYEEEENYQLKKDGAGEVLAATKNGENFKPGAEELHKLRFLKNDEFYSEAMQTGDLQLFFGDSTLRIEFSLKDSLPHGVFKLHRPEGSLAFYGEVQEGLSRGESFFLSAEGDTLMWQLKGPQKEVRRKEWLSDSSFRAEKYNKRGERLYSYETYPGGSPKILADEENKTYKRWNPEGQITSKSYPVKNDENRTVHWDYYPNGQLRSKYYMEERQKVGEFEFYHENGQLNTRCFYEEGKREGAFVNYFEDGSLRSKGQMVDDKKEGKWEVSREGEIVEEFYKNDKLQIEPPTGACACVDTALASGHFGFLNPLRAFLDYRRYKNLNFSFLQPLDSASYRGLFTHSKYGSSIDIIAYDPLTFRFDKSGDHSLTINACHTTGYLSRIHFLFWQHNGPESLRLILENAQLRYRFKNKLFQQAAGDHRISLLIESERAEFNDVEHIELEEPYTEPCFEPIRAGSWRLTAAKMRILPNVPPEKTIRWFQNESFSLSQLESTREVFMKDTTMEGGRPMLPHQTRILKPEFKKKTLHGFAAKSGSGFFALEGEDFSFRLRYIWLTDTWATGVFDVEVSQIAEDGSFTITSDAGKSVKSSLSKLKKQLEKDGLKGLKVEPYSNQNRIRVEFFNQ